MSVRGDSYLMLMKRADDQWMARLGFKVDDEWTPLEWRGLTTCREGIESANAIMRSVAEGEISSDPERLPLMRALGVDSICRQANRLKDGWGMVIWRMDDLWFAAIGHEAQLWRNEWAEAAASYDAVQAAGWLRIEQTCNAVVWRRDMLHTVNIRDEEGERVSRSQTNRNNINHDKNEPQKERDKQWRESPWPERWNRLIRRVGYRSDRSA